MTRWVGDGKLNDDEFWTIAFDIFVLGLSFLLGVGFSQYRGRVDGRFLSRLAELKHDVLDELYAKPCSGDSFILFMYIVIGIYIVAYVGVITVVESSIAPVASLSTLDNGNLPQWCRQVLLASAGSDSGLRYLPVFMTGIAIFSLAFVTAQYAAYTRMTLVLDVACRNVLDDIPNKLVPRDLDDLRREVFKFETFYEPPGNIFVTIGIAGTFMGLAFGLTTLPLREMMCTTGARDALIYAVPFVRSMGLALGISAAGVVGAIAAHVLRAVGGPSVTVEELLNRATTCSAKLRSIPP